MLAIILWSFISGVASSASTHQDTNGFQNLTSESVVFSEAKQLKITENAYRLVYWFSTAKSVQRVELAVEDELVATIADHEEFFKSSDSSALNSYTTLNMTAEELQLATVYGYVNVTGKFVGFSKIYVTLYGKEDQPIVRGALPVGVILEELFITKIYTWCFTVILISVYVNMGANLDLNIVKNIAKNPVGPAIGLFCQFGCMPMISYALGLLIFPDDPLYRLGLFASGSSPGGGLSNMWTHLLGGSLDLSIMMTFASTVLALGAVPMWLLTLGKVIVEDADIVIPFWNVIITIMTLVVPCFLGILIQIKFPRLTRIMKMIITPLSVVNICFIFSFGVYAHLYIFYYLTGLAVLAGFCQSLLGHIAGIIFAVIFRRKKKEIIAISIETAIQNNGVAFLVLKLSLESPAGDLAVLMPAAVVLLMPLLLFSALFIKVGYEKCCKKRFPDDKEAGETIEIEENEDKLSSIKTNLRETVQDGKATLPCFSNSALSLDEDTTNNETEKEGSESQEKNGDGELSRDNEQGTDNPNFTQESKM